MKRCELCGAEIPKDLEECSRCGFVFRKEIRSDVRNDSILKKHAGKPVTEVNRDLKMARTKFSACMDNMAAKTLSDDEVASLLDGALSYLQIPLFMGVEDELRFDSQETELIEQIAGCIEEADAKNGNPIGTPGTYVRLSNALLAMGASERAMEMIEKALLLNPRNREAMLSKAKLLFSVKKYPQARKCLEKVLAAGGDGDAIYLAELIDQISSD